jgi:hypothetical protein
MNGECRDDIADVLRDIRWILFHFDLFCIVRRFLILEVGLTTSEGGVYAFKGLSKGSLSL